jgi:acyl-CoA thioesterase
VETSISHLMSVKEGDVITTETNEISLSHKIGVYLISIKNQDDKEVAIFKGTVYRSSREWFPEDE